MTVIIDTSGWIEYFSEGKLSSKYSEIIENISPSECLTPTVVLYEVHKIMASHGDDTAALTAHSHIFNHTSIIDLTKSLAMEAAEISSSEKLPMADAIILATARRYDATIVTSDSHFKNKKGVKYIS